jgi:hypothetical protein
MSPSFKAEMAARLEAKKQGQAIGPPPLSIVISPGPRNAHTDPETGLRFYTWQGREVPSVTTIRRMAGVPHNLATWQVSQVILRAVTEIDTLNAMLTREKKPRERKLETNRLDEAGKWLRLAATEERDAASLLGTAVHDAAAQGLDPGSVPPEVRPRLLQFRHWLSVARPRIVGTEFQVFNLTVGYAGTCDLLCQFSDGSYWIIDLKTGKGTYPEHLLQVLMYMMGEFVGSDDVVDDELTGILRQVAGVGVLHLADDHWEFKRLDATADAWRASRGLLAFATWMHEHPMIDTVTLGSRTGSAPVTEIGSPLPIDNTATEA